MLKFILQPQCLCLSASSGKLFDADDPLQHPLDHIPRRPSYLFIQGNVDENEVKPFLTQLGQDLDLLGIYTWDEAYLHAPSQGPSLFPEAIAPPLIQKLWRARYVLFIGAASITSFCLGSLLWIQLYLS